MASSQGAIRGAEEVGAKDVPQATLYLQLAREEREKALAMIKAEDNHGAEMMLARSEADAELAVALAKQAQANKEAQSANAEVDALKEKAQ